MATWGDQTCQRFEAVCHRAPRLSATSRQLRYSSFTQSVRSPHKKSAYQTAPPTYTHCLSGTAPECPHKHNKVYVAKCFMLIRQQCEEPRSRNKMRVDSTHNSSIYHETLVEIVVCVSKLLVNAYSEGPCFICTVLCMSAAVHIYAVI